MLIETIFVSEAHFAMITGERLFPRMDKQMLFESALLCEAFIAVITAEWPLPSMNK